MASTPHRRGAVTTIRRARASLAPTLRLARKLLHSRGMSRTLALLLLPLLMLVGRTAHAEADAPHDGLARRRAGIVLVAIGAPLAIAGAALTVATMDRDLRTEAP